jgi:outer membrane protein TolC
MAGTVGGRTSASRTLVLGFVGALIAAGAARPAEPDPGRRKLTLDECVHFALDNQPAIQARQAGVGVAADQQKVARSYFFPQAGVTTRFTQLDRHVFAISPGLTGGNADLFTDAAAFFGIARQAGPAAANAALANPGQPPFSTAKQAAQLAVPTTLQTDLLGERSLNTEVLVTQPLYTGGKVRYRNDQARLGIQAAESDVAQTRQQIVFEVSRAYYGVLLARELARVADDAVAQYRYTEALAQSLLDEADKYVTTADVRRASALRLLAANQQLQARRAADQALAGLRAAMGLGQAAALDVADERLTLRTTTLEKDALVGKALAQRPEMAKAQLAVQAAELERKLAKAQFHPDVAAFSRLTTIHDNRDYPNPTQPTQFAAGVEASLPLVAGGRRLAERHKADDLLAQATAVRDVVRNQIELEVEQAFLEYQEMTERLPLAARAVEDAAGAVKAYKDKYAADRVAPRDMPKHLEDLSLTRLLLSQAQAGYHQQVYAYYLALVKIRLATGSHD